MNLFFRRCDYCGKRQFLLQLWRTSREILRLCTGCHAVESFIEQAKQTGNGLTPQEDEPYPLSRGD